MFTEGDVIYVLTIAGIGLVLGYLIVNAVSTIIDKIKHKKDDKKNK